MGFDQPLFLTRVVVHQGAGPGALSSVEARGLEGGPWKPLWQRDEAEAAAYAKQQLELQPLQWQGVTPTKSLRLNVDTSLVPGFNQVDAVEVHGLAEDGAPVAQTVGGTCPPGGTACWVECQPLQVGGGQNARVALEALDGAVRWLRSALQTAPKTAPLPIAGPGSTALPACAEVLASLAAANGGQTAGPPGRAACPPPLPLPTTLLCVASTCRPRLAGATRATDPRARRWAREGGRRAPTARPARSASSRGG